MDKMIQLHTTGTGCREISVAVEESIMTTASQIGTAFLEEVFLIPAVIKSQTHAATKLFPDLNQISMFLWT